MDDWQERIDAVWHAAGERDEQETVAAIDALVAERDSGDPIALFEAEAAAHGHRLDGWRVLKAISGDIRPQMIEALRRCKARFRVACITNNMKHGEGPGMARSPDKAAAIIVGIFMRKTRLGAFIYASGDNPNAARIAGIPVRPILMLQYIIAGVVAMFAGLVLSASNSSMDTRIFNLTWIYDVILVVVLGGIGLSGGRGGVLNVVIGTLLIGTIVNGMTIMNVSFEMQNLIKGVVLLAALSIDSVVNPRNEETAQQGDI